MKQTSSALHRHLQELGLSQFQIDSLAKTIVDYLLINQQDTIVRPSVCPHCNQTARIYKRGKRNKSGKQRFSCCNCGTWFVYDTHQITFHSHQSHSKWCVVINDTFNLVSLEETAAKIDVSVGTAFNMRHKLLQTLEELMSSFSLGGIIEADETYILESEKGSRHCSRKARKRGGKATKRGVSNEQCCILVAIERNGNAYAKHIGFGKPRSSEIESTLHNIVRLNSDLITDGETAYNDLAIKKMLTHYRIGNHKTYTSLLHINTVNAMHTKLQSMIIKYRGVATHYMNHYCALLTFSRRFQDMGHIEILSALLRLLKDSNSYNSLKRCLSH